MLFNYLPVHFFVEFSDPVVPDNNPVYVLRSVLGLNLRSICCIAHKETCENCMYCKTCSYSAIFESIIDNKNEVLPGRNRVSHPYAFTSNTKIESLRKPIKSFDFTISLFGSAIAYLPYIYAAFYKAGQKGMFKSRTKFSITDVQVGNSSILIDEQTIKNDLDPFVFKYVPSKEFQINTKEILVELKTPLRFKTEGKYILNFSSKDFFACLNRRFMTLIKMYGNSEENEFSLFETRTVITDRNLHWLDNPHYSSRQKNVMELGGVLGTFKLEGEFSEYELKLLEFNRLVNSGKNTNFGLGQIDYWMK